MPLSVLSRSLACLGALGVSLVCTWALSGRRWGGPEGVWAVNGRLGVARGVARGPAGSPAPPGAPFRTTWHTLDTSPGGIGGGRRRGKGRDTSPGNRNLVKELRSFKNACHP